MLLILIIQNIMPVGEKTKELWNNPEYRENQIKKHLGHKVSEETKKKIGLNGFHYGMLGKKHTEEWKKNKSISLKGRIKSLEECENISKARKGDKHPHKGQFFSEETRLKISKAHKGKKMSEESKLKLSLLNRGDKHPQWKGGISNNPYSVDWTQTLKRSIRERDKYTCKICGEQQCDISFSVHHIDYNKNNCEPNNLITLCNKCHAKTNHNREYWVEYFKKYE